METSVVPVDTDVSKDIQHAVHEATGELFDKIAKSMRDIAAPPQEAKPHGYYVDPFAMLDSVGMGYRANPSRVTYETLRQMGEQDTLIGSIINTRSNQFSTFCQDQENKYSVGNLIRFKDKTKRSRRMNNGERDRAKKIEFYVQNMGVESNITRPGLVNAGKMMVRDSLSYDQVNFENVYNRGGKLHESLVMDAATVRIADQSKSNPKGHPIARANEKSHVMYAQIMNGEILREFTARELAFCIRNPRSSVKVGGYGFPEPQILIQTVTAHIWAEEWNRKAFSQGSTVKGVLNMKGNIDRQKYNDFKRQWMSQVGGITNAWKTPIINSDGIDFVQMQMSNTEMGYQMWIEYLVKIACAIYQMDPSEINFDLRGGAGGQQPVFMGNNEAQQKLSKDRGLKPLLSFFADTFNRNIVSRIDDEFELAFVGLDAKSEEQAVELRSKQGTTMLTINELRELEDLPPIKYGDIVANPAYISYLQQKEMSEQQGGGAPPGGGMPGQEGGEDDQQPPEQPYANRFGSAGSEPSQTSKQAGKRLGAMARGSKSQDDTHEEDDDIRYLKQNDWESSVHASLRDNDIFKSGEGSRGGVVIGHTKSGKPVYQSFIQQQEYGGSIRDWTADDHHDAAELHLNSRSEPGREKSHGHSAASHINLARKIYESVDRAMPPTRRSPPKKKKERKHKLTFEERHRAAVARGMLKDDTKKSLGPDFFEIDL